MTAALLTSEIPSDVTGWWVSEKFDGVRCIAHNGKLFTRHGKPLNAPAWFTAGLPKNHRLDGELWMGRGTFDKLQSVLQKKNSDWNGVMFMVFDLAEPGAFEARLRELCKLNLPSHCGVVHHIKCTGHEHLSRIENDIYSEGGEGCVIRRPGSKYRPGRMGDTIKVKRLVADVDRWQG